MATSVIARDDERHRRLLLNSSSSPSFESVPRSLSGADGATIAEIRGSLLKHSLWLLLANTTLGLVLVPLTVSSVPVSLFIAGFAPFYAVILLSLWLLGGGRRQAAAWTVVVGIFALQCLGNFFNPGAAEQAMASFINLILLAGFALNQRAGLLTAIVALAGMTAYLVMSDQGLLPTPMLELSLMERLPLIALTVLTTGGLVTIAVTHVTWAFNREQRARRLAQDTSASLSDALAENALRASMSQDLVGMGQRLLTSTSQEDQLRTVAETFLGVKGITAVVLRDSNGVDLLERVKPGSLQTGSCTLRVPMKVPHCEVEVVLSGRESLLQSEATADFSRTAAGLLRTAGARLEAERQLQQAERLQALGRLAAGIAHDFNNLLLTIQGGVELAQVRLREGRPPEPQLLAVQDATARAVRLTRRMGTLTDSKEQQRHPVSLAPVLRALVASARTTLPAGVALEVVEPLPLAELTADEVELEQIVLNLINNAAESIDGEGTVTVSVREGDSERGAVVLEIRDTGSGMSRSVADRVFEPFFTTRQAAGGHGLGLTGVKALVDRLDGGIAVESAVGEGSRFSVLLPVATFGSPAAVGTGEDAVAACASSDASFELVGHHVLVVDDEPEVRNVVGLLLDSIGAVVTTAGSGEEALELLAEKSDITLLVTDVRMPGMDGHALLRAVRDAGHGLPAILASGFDPDELKDALRLTPFTRLAKPFRRDQLLAAVRSVVAAGGAGSTPTVS